MPRFFFDTIDTGRAAEDDDGTELASLEVAKREALATLGEIAHDELPNGDARGPAAPPPGAILPQASRRLPPCCAARLRTRHRPRPDAEHPAGRAQAQAPRDLARRAHRSISVNTGQNRRSITALLERCRQRITVERQWLISPKE